MMPEYVAEIRDPIHGYIRVTDVERHIIDSPFVQRLRRIHQLAGAYMVYPGAVHTRFEHVIGAMSVAGTIMDSLSERTKVSKEDHQEVRLAALLHDVGHGPYSHMFEEVLADKKEVTHEAISQRIVRETVVRDTLEKHGFSARKMSSFAVGKQDEKPRFMNEVIAGGLSADIMDYLPRDSYFTGVEYGKVDIHRVIGSLSVDRGHLALDHAALYAFEALLLARYEMFKAVYFHRTARAAELMLVQAMKLADPELHLTDLGDLNAYLQLTDEVVLHRLVTMRPSNRATREASSLARDFSNRRLMKCVFERMVLRKDKAVEQIFSRKKVRDQVVKEIARKAGADPSHVYLDVPTAPSIPYTPSNEALTSVTLTYSDGGRRRFKKTPVDELTIVGSITGFIDFIRVYTRAQDRDRVARATASVFEDERYATAFAARAR